MIANTAGGVSFDTDDETELILESLDDCANGLAEETPAWIWSTRRASCGSSRIPTRFS